MSAALITTTLLGLGGLVYTGVLGFATGSSAEISQHASFGIFFTLIVLLAHSMTMFYLIGKGKAVREAAADGQLSTSFYAAVAGARKPVFSVGIVAMFLTMATGIVGGGVDTGSIPTGVHAILALSAVAANVMAFRTEVSAMLESARVVAEVDALLAENT